MQRIADFVLGRVKGISRDQAEALAAQYWRQGLRDMEEIAFLAMLSPKKSVKLGEIKGYCATPSRKTTVGDTT